MVFKRCMKAQRTNLKKKPLLSGDKKKERVEKKEELVKQNGIK